MQFYINNFMLAVEKIQKSTIIYYYNLQFLV